MKNSLLEYFVKTVRRCPDIRNTEEVDIFNILRKHTQNISVYDSRANAKHVFQEYCVIITNELPTNQFAAVILAMAHKEFLNLDVKSLVKDNGVIYDVKGVLPREMLNGRL